MKREARTVHQLLTRFGLTLATAESCTGGWIGKLLTDFSGSSKYFKGGAVVYSNDAKRKVLGVPIRKGEPTVTRKIAIEMAARARDLFDADLAVSTTGYMEPTPELAKQFARKKITGVCFVALAYRTRADTRSERANRQAKVAVRCIKLFLRDTRHQNRVSATTAALHLIINSLK